MNYWIIPAIVAPSKQKQADNLIARVCLEFNTTVEPLKLRSRKRELVIPRQIAFYLLRTKLDLTLSDIGRMFNRDHATVLYSVRTVKNFLEFDDYYKEKIGKILG